MFTLVTLFLVLPVTLKDVCYHTNKQKASFVLRWTDTCLHLLFTEKKVMIKQQNLLSGTNTECTTIILFVRLLLFKGPIYNKIHLQFF